MSEAGYETVIHRAAQKELESIPEHVADDIRDIVKRGSRHRDPTDVKGIDHLHSDGLLKVKIGNWRAILTLDNPKFRLLLVDNRRRVYDRLFVAQRRATEGVR